MSSWTLSAGAPEGDGLIYEADGLPDGLEIDPFTGLISGTVADEAISTTPYAVTIFASDENGQSASQSFNWIVNDPALTTQTTPVNGVFTVQGDHSYAVDGPYTVTVTITDNAKDADNALTASASVSVVRPPLVLEADSQGAPLGGVLSNVEVASFTEPDASDGMGEFVAAIDWGDNSGSDGKNKGTAYICDR